MKYDSKAERLYHEANPHLIKCSDNYPVFFLDDERKAFHAVPDFYDEATQTYIEFKARRLNNIKTQSEAQSKWSAQLPYITIRNRNIKQLELGWNHSVHKQAAVQEQLKEKGYKMLVVFQKGTKLTPQAKNKMNKLNLDYKIENSADSALQSEEQQ